MGVGLGPRGVQDSGDGHISSGMLTWGKIGYSSIKEVDQEGFVARP